MGRERCRRCDRPAMVCLCEELPASPLPTRTTVVVLQHPHEARHKLSTLPLLTKCLANCHTLQGRRFRQGASPLLDFLWTNSDSPSCHALLLFPTPTAQPIASWLNQISLHPSRDRILQGYDHIATCPPSCNTELCTRGMQTCSSLRGSCLDSVQVACHRSPPSDLTSQHAGIPCSTRNGADVCRCQRGSEFPLVVLIAIDATWQHANEMLRTSASFLEKFTVPVCLPFDANQEGPCIANSDLIIRKEPFKGCMTTIESISLCLKVLEPNGVEIHDKLTCVLRRMVQCQVSNIISHKFRTDKRRGFLS